MIEFGREKARRMTVIRPSSCLLCDVSKQTFGGVQSFVGLDLTEQCLHRPAPSGTSAHLVVHSRSVACAQGKREEEEGEFITFDGCLSPPRCLTLLPIKQSGARKGARAFRHLQVLQAGCGTRGVRVLHVRYHLAQCDCAVGAALPRSRRLRRW